MSDQYRAVLEQIAAMPHQRLCAANSFEPCCAVTVARRALDGVKVVAAPCTSCERQPHEVNHPAGMVFVGFGLGWQACPVCGGSTQVAEREASP